MIPALALLALAAAHPVDTLRPRLLDDFERLAPWSAHPADGVALALAADEGALRLDFDIPGGGYAIARRELRLDLPAGVEAEIKL